MGQPDFTLACDIMMDLEGSIRPAKYLADALKAKGYTVSMMSPAMSRDVENNLGSLGMTPTNLHARLFMKSFGLSLLWLETWGREAFLRLNSRRVSRDSQVLINFSHTLVVPSMFWYLQGPASAALRDMKDELTVGYRSAYKVLRPMLEYTDGKLATSMCKQSKFVVANSNFCASLYRGWGITIDSVIYPPIDCEVFRSKVSNPSQGYVLTYFGKETRFSVIKVIADLGVRIKAFGSKAPFIPRGLSTHPNIDFLGRIPISELVETYSNALFTLFPFTHEPFGYIPVESMACGTPTLTYNAQGPSESVIDGYTGWLAKTDDEMISKTLDLWKEGYPPEIRTHCIKEASRFDRKLYVDKWFDLIAKVSDHS